LRVGRETTARRVHGASAPTLGGRMPRISESIFRPISTLLLCAAVFVTAAPRTAVAQGPKKAASAELPRSATARCSDNSWSSAASEQGACSKHGGVAKWFGKAPKGATARCKDGEYWTSPESQGACS